MASPEARTAQLERPPVPAPWPGVVYFTVVFGAGFVLGPIRVRWLVPLVGVRAAELIEAPLMLVVITLAARLVVRRCRVPATARAVVGLVALVLLVLAELGLAFAMMGLSPVEYVSSRDAVAGPVHAASVLFFAVAPLVVARQPAVGTTPARGA